MNSPEAGAARTGTAVPNMDDLPELNMEAVLANVAELYGKTQPSKPNQGWSAIYTSVGPVLIVMNPFKPLPLVGPEWTKAFREAGEAGQIEWAWQKLGPHCYWTAEQAYQALRVVARQSIIICGESGAGKTYTNRMMIEYLLDAEALSSTQGADQGSKEKIAHANALLEFFGNAKTVRNDNSSRFGKYSQLSFDNGSITSFQIEHYLLERSRVCFEPAGERNYHIFHQLVRLEEGTYGLQGGPQAYVYTRDGANVKCVDGTAFDDVGDFKDLCNRMEQVGIKEKERASVFQVIAAVLHIGNVEIEGDRDTSKVAEASTAEFQKACELLAVDAEKMSLALVTKKTKLFEKPYGKKDAEAQRDAVAKMIYARVFDDLVRTINDKLLNRRHGTMSGGTAIGLLDIFGFEDMPVNGLEQLYINLTNERIQHLFNEAMFAKELEVYKNEGIESAFESPPSNMPCIDLFMDRRPPGIISLIASAVKAPGTKNDGEYLVRQFNRNLKDHPFYTVCEAQQMKQVNDLKRMRWPKTWKKLRYNNCFQIKHYVTQPVVYTVEEFVSKSRDALNPLLSQLLHESTETYVRGLFGGGESEASKLTVGEKFRSQLLELADKLSMGNNFFVRCIKPNPKSIPGIVDDEMVLDQLVSGGVVSALEMRKHGYADRLDYTAFVKEFWILEPGRYCATAPRQPREQVELLLSNFVGHDSKQYACGATKVFMRCGVLSTLRKLIQFRIYRFAIVVQRRWRVKKGTELIGKLKRLQQDLQAEKDDAEAQGFAEVKAVSHAISSADQLMQTVTKDLEHFRATHSDDTPRTQIRNIAFDMAKHKGSVPQLQQLIGDVKAAVEKITARKNDAVNLLSARLSALRQDLSKLVARVDEVETTHLKGSSDAEVECGGVCRQARERVDQLCRVDIPRLADDGPVGFNLAVEYLEEDPCPEASTLLSEVEALVVDAEAKGEAISGERFAFNQRTKSLLDRREKAKLALQSLQEDARNAAAESLNGVGDAFDAAWSQEGSIEELQAAALSEDSLAEAVDTFEKCVERAKQKVEDAKAFMEQDESQVQADFDELSCRAALHNAGAQFLQRLIEAQNEISDKAAEQDPTSSSNTSASSRTLAKLKAAAAAVRALGITEDAQMPNITEDAQMPSITQDAQTPSITEDAQIPSSVTPMAGSIETRPESIEGGNWCTENTHELGPDPGDEVLSTAQLLPAESFTSVSRAVAGLQMGIVTCESGFCIVYSGGRDSYFLIFTPERKEMALQMVKEAAAKHKAASQVVSTSCQWTFADVSWLQKLNPNRWSHDITFESAIDQLEKDTARTAEAVLVKVPAGVLSVPERFETMQEAIEYLKRLIGGIQN